MVANYDAKAIAEVLGLGFLRGSLGGAPIKASPRIRSRSPHDVGEFVIEVDDAAMLVVEPTAEGKWTAFKTSKNVGRSFNETGTTMSPPSFALIEKAVERGLPRNALRHVVEALVGGDATKASALEWGVVPKTTLDRRDTRLSAQESERTERIARLFVHARRALGTEGEAREFMTMPHPELDGRTPLEGARTDLATRRVEQILTALEYGLAL